MPQRQPELFDKYKGFGFFEDDYPKDTFTPLHRLFSRKVRVLTEGRHPREFTVDLSIGECNCQKGVAWRRDEKTGKWFRNAYCAHKLRAMSRIVTDALPSANVIEARELQTAYIKALGTRYNPFELVSAFHKELRRGDFEMAWFFGVLLTSKRSIRGVIEYLINILYEETRDHELGDYLLDLRFNPRAHTLANLSKAISWFCGSVKKWEIPRRMSVFTAEMHGYRLLVKDYGVNVARGSNIIPHDQKSKLTDFLLKGANTDNEVMFQRGLKGLQKLQYLDSPGDDYARAANAKRRDDLLNDHRYWIYSTLYELAEKLWQDNDKRWSVFAYVNRRIENNFGIGYHELNALGDAIMGEAYDVGILSPQRKDIFSKRPPAAIVLGKWHPIPLYAHDNHTWAGKALLRRFPEQLLPKRKQTDLDFRWCGAYFGVCYRMLAYTQHKRVADWHEVDWPKDLHGIVNSLWY